MEVHALRSQQPISPVTYDPYSIFLFPFYFFMLYLTYTSLQTSLQLATGTPGLPLRLP
jgi:hypothetical protein